MTRLGGARDAVTAVLGGGQGSRLWPLTRTAPSRRCRWAASSASSTSRSATACTPASTASSSSPSSTARACTATSPRPTASTPSPAASSTSWPPSRRSTNRDWYQGTADAVRQTLDRLSSRSPPEILILSGDQLYLMNIAEFLEHPPRAPRRPDDRRQAGHRARRPRRSASCASTPTGRIVEFVEKPKEAEQLDALRARRADPAALGLPGAGRLLPRQHGHLRLPPARCSSELLRRQPTPSTSAAR